MSKRQRAVRDALLGPMFALCVFTYRQFVLGQTYVAIAGAVGVLITAAAYRYADAKLIEAAVDAGDVEDLKPVLRRVGSRLKQYRSK